MNTDSSGYFAQHIELCLVTASHSYDDAQKLCSSWWRGDLDFEGNNRAYLAGHSLRYHNFDLVMCSENKKAKQTMEKFKASFTKHGGKWPNLYVEHSLLNDFKFGVCEGSPKEIYLDSLEKSTAPIDIFHPKGGENLKSLNRRVKDFLTRMACAYLWEKPDGAIKPFKNSRLDSSRGAFDSGVHTRTLGR